METQEFHPQNLDAYVHHCLEHTAVCRFLEKNQYQKPIYIITAVKIVLGSFDANKSKPPSLSLNLGAQAGNSMPRRRPQDFTYTFMFSKRLRLGERPGHMVSAGWRTVCWEDGSDFVLAIRVLEVNVSQDGKVETKIYTQGATLGDEHDGPIEPIAEVPMESRDSAPEVEDDREREHTEDI